MFTFIGTFTKLIWDWKGGISIDKDSGNHGYVLWYCGRRSQDFLPFIYFCSGHTVMVVVFGPREGTLIFLNKRQKTL